jgi:hypothetical protein
MTIILFNHDDATRRRGLPEPVDAERSRNYVPSMFNREGNMFRAFIEEAAALASITLFIGMIAVWAQVLAMW